MSDEYRDYVLDLLAPLGEIESARFFGGVGFKRSGIQFAMLMRDTLYFVVDDSTRPKYVAAGSKPFSYEKKGGVQQVKRYYEVPADVLDDSARFAEWAEESIAAARKKK